MVSAASPRRHEGSRVVAVTGVAEFLGKELLGLLDHDPRYRKVLALDVREPVHLGRRTQFCQLDLTDAEASQGLTDLFLTHRVSVLVHGAFLSRPAHDLGYAHELQVIGTLHLLGAAAAAGVGKVVFLGSTQTYGARPDNPNFLGEDRPRRGVQGCAHIGDLIEAEDQLWAFAAKHPEVVVTSLRLASLMGANSDGFFARLLNRPVVPMVLGHDPLLQFLHEGDALETLKRVVDEDHPGAFNVAADGVVPLSAAVRLAGRLPLPFPYPLAGRLGGFLWALQLLDMPPAYLDYLRYLWVADTSKAKRELVFAPKFSSREALSNFVRLGRLRQTPLLGDS